jgi:hypothetical protein
VITHSTATRFNQATRFGLFQTIIRPCLFHSININVACSKVFIALSPEQSIKTLPASRHVGSKVFIALSLEQSIKTLPAPKHVASKVFVIILEEMRSDDDDDLE